MTGLSKARDERQTRQRGIFSSLFDDFINDRFFNSFEAPKMMNRYSIPAANISEEETCYLIALAVPGMHKDDFEISLDNDLLTIKAEKKHSESQNEDLSAFTRQEYNYRSFSRSFTLPNNVDPENIGALYENGILNIKICKIEDNDQLKSIKKIEIK